jgi:hypothetical protein
VTVECGGNKQQSMASSAEGAGNGSEEPFITDHILEAEQFYDLGCAAMMCDAYDEASEYFSKALDLRSV